MLGLGAARQAGIRGVHGYRRFLPLRFGAAALPCRWAHARCCPDQMSVTAGQAAAAGKAVDTWRMMGTLR